MCCGFIAYLFTCFKSDKTAIDIEDKMKLVADISAAIVYSERDRSIHFDEITSNVFIGDHISASTVNTNNGPSGITHVVNCASSEYQQPYPSNIQVLRIAANDDGKYSIIEKHLKEVLYFVDQALNENNGKNENRILFHCLAGVNRSVCLCCAYLYTSEIQAHSSKFDDMEGIVSHVSGIRTIGVLHNLAFVQQLALLQLKNAL